MLGALRGLVAAAHRHPGPETFGHTPSASEVVGNALVRVLVTGRNPAPLHNCTTADCGVRLAREQQASSCS